MIFAHQTVSATSAPFRVFFEHDSSTLDAYAKRVIQQACDVILKHGPVLVILDSHADRSGSADYNLDLARRRGETVKAQMVRSGFNADDFQIDAFGETRPMVETADGVREPHNRLVHISFGAVDMRRNWNKISGENDVQTAEPRTLTDVRD